MRTSLVAAALLAAAIVSTPAADAISTPTTPTPPVYPAAGQLTTVATIDAATGKVISRWTGPQSQKAQAVQSQRSAVGAPVPASVTSSSPGGVMPLISRHNPCTPNTGYFELWNSGLVCFANAGGTSVAIYGVYEVDTGNNVGGVYWQCGGGTCDSGYWPRWSTIFFNAPYPTVTFVYIQ